MAEGSENMEIIHFTSGNWDLSRKYPSHVRMHQKSFFFKDIFCNLPAGRLGLDKVNLYSNVKLKIKHKGGS
jgi:hypothetical protein